MGKKEIPASYLLPRKKKSHAHFWKSTMKLQVLIVITSCLSVASARNFLQTDPWHPLLEHAQDGSLQMKNYAAGIQAAPATSFLELGSTVMAPIGDKICSCKIIEESPVQQAAGMLPSPAIVATPRAAALSSSPPTMSFRQMMPSQLYSYPQPMMYPAQRFQNISPYQQMGNIQRLQPIQFN